MGSVEDATTPAAWVIVKKDGMTFYYNKVSKEAVWDKPIVLCNSWEEILLSFCPWKETTKDGSSYFYHSGTKVGTWIMPEELQKVKDQIEAERRSKANIVQSTSSATTPVASAASVSMSTTQATASVSNNKNDKGITPSQMEMILMKQPSYSKIMNSQSNDNQYTVSPIPIQSTKLWHTSVRQDLRNHLLDTLVKTMFPTLNPQDVSDPRLSSKLSSAKKLEGDMYEQANSSSEYYFSLYVKIYKIKNDLEKKARAKRQAQQALQSSTVVQPTSSVTTSVPSGAPAVPHPVSNNTSPIHTGIHTSDPKRKLIYDPTAVGPASSC